VFNPSWAESVALRSLGRTPDAAAGWSGCREVSIKGLLWHQEC
jgi:hypothetical protein